MLVFKRPSSRVWLEPFCCRLLADWPPDARLVVPPWLPTARICVCSSDALFGNDKRAYHDSDSRAVRRSSLNLDAWHTLRSAYLRSESDVVVWLENDAIVLSCSRLTLRFDSFTTLAPRVPRVLASLGAFMAERGRLHHVSTVGASLDPSVCFGLLYGATF